MIKSDFQVVPIRLEQTGETKWFLENTKLPEQSADRCFRGKYWDTEAQAKEFLTFANMEDILAIKGKTI